MIDKPLSGYTVLDLTRVLAGPYCTMMLCNLGAEIIKVESPGSGDDSRSYGPHINGESIYFLSVNRGKKSIAIDLKSPEGQAIFRDLARKADILVENYRPGTMEKLGLGYERLKENNPQLIYAAISGFGHSGPYSAKPAYDMIVQGMGGIMSITGEPDGNPVRVGTSIGDITAGMFGAYGILAAVIDRGKTGLGQKIDVAMLDCQIAILENAVAKTSITGKAPGPLGLRHPSISPFEAYRTADSWVIVAAGNDKLFTEFCKVIGAEFLISDHRFKTNAARNHHMFELSEIIQSIMLGQSTAEWLDILGRHNIPAGPINTIDKLFSDPHVHSRNMIVEVDQPNIGKVKVAGNPVKMSAIPPADEIPQGHAPRLGEHTCEVLIRHAGYAREKAADYRRKLFNDEEGCS